MRSSEKILRTCKKIIFIIIEGNNMKNSRKIIRKTPFIFMVILCALVFGIYVLISNASAKKTGKGNDLTASKTTESDEYQQRKEPTKENPTEISKEQSSETSSEETEATQETETATEDYFKDTLFIGNSRVEGLYMYHKRLPDSATFYTIEGISVWHIMDTSANVPPDSSNNMSFKSCVTMKKYDKIYIMLGINEIGTGNADSFAEAYGELIDYLKSAQPDAKIVIMSMLHVTKAKSDSSNYFRNDIIDERNEKVKALCDEERVFWLNINDAFDDGNGNMKEDYTSDGVHPSAKSISIWEDYLFANPV